MASTDHTPKPLPSQGGDPADFLPASTTTPKERREARERREALDQLAFGDN